MGNIINILKRNSPVLIIIVLWFLFSAPYFFKGLVPFPSKYLVTFFPPWSATYAMPVKNNAMPDVITQIYPWKKFTIESWKKGEVPLWNPNSFGGTVQAGNYQSAVFSPFNSLFFVLPFIDAWSILILLQPLFAGLFMVMFLREIGCKDFSSIIGGVGFMFSGFLVTWMAYGTLGYAVLFLPLILWSVDRYLKKRSWKYLCVGALSISLSFLSGHFQISVYILIASVCYVLFCSYRNKQWKEGLVFMLAVLSGVCISAPQLFLTYDAFALSVRASNTSLKEVIPWQYLVTFFSPDFYGNPVTRNDWFGHYAEWAGYVGIVPLLIGLYGIFFGTSRKKVYFSIVFIVSLLLAYASPLSGALFAWKFPVLSTSAASRIIIITSFSLCVLGSL